MLIPLNSTSFKPAPEGPTLGLCVRVIDLGTQRTEFSGSIKHQRKLVLGFELPNVKIDEGDHAGEPYIIHQRFTASMSDKANLRPFIENWFAKKFVSPEQIHGLASNMHKLLGQPGLVNIVHSKDGKYANISTIMKWTGPKAELPTPFNKLIAFSLDPSSFDPKVLAVLGEGFQEAIKSSPEYKVVTGQQPDAAPESDGPPPDDDNMPY